MILSRHRQFVSDSDLAVINQELLHTPGWIYRWNFWRYYLIDGLQAYQEADARTWYGHQNIVPRLSEPWQKLFESVQDLAGFRFVIQRYALTGQTQGQYQTLHRDTGLELQGDFRSYLIYLNDSWQPDQGGSTHLVDDHRTHNEWPEPGKLIEFNSQTLHCGNPPDIANTLRMTLVIHGQLQ